MSCLFGCCVSEPIVGSAATVADLGNGSVDFNIGTPAPARRSTSSAAQAGTKVLVIFFFIIIIIYLMTLSVTSRNPANVWCDF